MSVDKVRGNKDNIEPEKKGEKKMREGVGEQFKEIEKSGAVDPDNRRRRQQQSDPLTDLNSAQKKFNSGPPLDSNDNRGPLQAPTPTPGAKSFSQPTPRESAPNYIPNTPSNAPAPAPSAPLSNQQGNFDQETNSPNEKAPASSSENRETGSQQEPENSDKKADAKKKEGSQTPLDEIGDFEVEIPPVAKEKIAPKLKDIQNPKPFEETIKKEEPAKTGPLKEPHKNTHKETHKAPAKTTAKKGEGAKESMQGETPKDKKPLQEKEVKAPSPLTLGEAAAASGSGNQPTIIVGSPAPNPIAPSHRASSQLSHPQVARLFDQMVSHLTAISHKGVKEVTITLSSGVFRGSQIVIKETTTALRNYNIELRGMTAEAQNLFEKNLGSLVQMFATTQLPFNVHRLETRPLIERKEKVGDEKDEEEGKEQQ